MDFSSPEIFRALAAAAGGCTYPFLRPEPTWRRNFAVAGIGTATALIGAPWACLYLQIDAEHGCNLLHAGVGLTGYLLAKVVITTAESTLTPQWMTRLIWRLLGVPETPPITLDSGTTPPAPRPRRRKKRGTDDQIPKPPDLNEGQE